jgi:adenine-specific DNA-methyltransferase
MESEMKKVELEDGQSADIVSENVSKLKELFPDAFSEGGVNFDTLRQLLGDASVLDEGEEKYGLNWHGKKKARQIALTPSTGTLLPCPDESVDWDTTQNLFIEGDNLEVLKLLQKSYATKVKMIYIDPPYNTGNEFIYPDKFQENLETYLKYTGQVDDEGMKFSSKTESAGRKHTNWLNMMLPRLKVARNLLSDEGVIFINIGEEELHNLTHLADSIFGEENRLSVIARVAKTASDQGTYFAPSIDFVLCYAKHKGVPRAFKDKIDESLFKRVEDSGERQGERYRDDVALYQSSLTLERSRNARYFIETPDGKKCIPPEGKRWRVVEESYLKFLNDEHIVFKKTKTSPLFDENGEKSEWNIYTKSYLKDRMEDGKLPRNYLDKFINRKGADLIKKFGINFTFSKPVELMQHFMEIIGVDDEDIVLDFFSGSGSTAHSVFNYNREAQKAARFICIQLPEVIDSKNSEFSDICELARERIRRVGAEHKDDPALSGADLGFKSFKLSGSNINIWNPDRIDLEETLLSHEEHLAEGRSEQDILYELLLKRGIDLAVPIENREVSSKNIYSIGYGVLFACLDESITNEQVENIAQEIIAWYGELAPSSDTHVFFRDSAFRDDISKTNMAAILEQNGITHVRSL